jgi:TonB-linked SusC/RagA family outer membrane protein
MVLDEQQDPVPGATVMVKGNSDYGTITDSDGEFSINIPAEENVLVISFIGMKTQEIDVSNTSSITIILESEIVHLAETVVVGYGIQKKETLTGSIANISGDDIRKSPEANVTASLQGKLPGLTINQRTGEPGSEELEILIRGNGTFRDNSPLIIVDGVERSNMSRLNPDDIESISVLKDASAAIYGARAANGVIIITSKSGKEGKPEFNFSYNYAFQSPTQIPEMLDAATFAEAYNEGDWYRQGRPDEYIPFYSENAIQKYRDGSDPVLYPNTDWVDVTMRSYAPQQRTNLQVTGGSDKVTYLLSFGIMDQEGIMKNNPTHYRQYNLRSNINVNLTENLSLGANIYAILNDREYPSTYADNPDNDYWVDFYNILQANPTLPARYPNGLIAPGRLQENPLLLDRRGYYKVEDRPVYSTFKGTYKVPFVEGLKIDASFNYDLSHQFSKRWSTPYYYHEYNVNSDEYEKKWATNEPTAELTDTYNRWTTMLYNYKIVYDRDFGKHHVGAMVGQEIQKTPGIIPRLTEKIS